MGASRGRDLWSGFVRSQLGVVLALLFAAGCSSDPAADVNAPKYYEDVAPLINRSCVNCHREGGIAPFALTDFGGVRDHASEIASDTAARIMPPMPVDNSGSCNTYANARWLTNEEISLLSRWAKAGTPAGDSSKAPAVPDAPPPLGRADAMLDIGVSYAPSSADGHDDYRCFVVPAPVTELQYVTAYEVLPGQAREVHHVIVYQPNDEDAAQAAHDLDDAAAGDGYPCFGGAGVDSSPLAMWAPGAGAILLPEGTGVQLAAKRDLIIQIHYNLDNGTMSDRTQVALQFATKPVITAQYWSMADTELRLPPGKKQVESMSSVALDPGRFTIYGAMPHMHTLGRTLQVDVEADGASRCLVNVDRWDFHWQNAWWYEEPLLIDKPSSMSIRCGYDTSDKTSIVTWGENTSDEMCLSFLYITTKTEPDVPPAPPNCDDETNPLFGSCIDQMLTGCYAPDLTGKCTSANGNVSWSDGSKIIGTGSGMGFYPPGSAKTCIDLSMTANGFVLTKADQSLVYKTDGDKVTLDCPDGAHVEASGAQLSTYGQCRGLACPQ
jgi:Copper type II ascorbate-dependent monooxygenase, C-terminal domain/Copper type II ascorbate-dependent monooxygenase, N-terminal domain